MIYYLKGYIIYCQDPYFYFAVYKIILDGINRANNPGNCNIDCTFCAH